MTVDPEQGFGWVSTALAALGSAGGGALLLRRILRKEATDTKQDGREAAHFSRLEAQIEEQRKDIAALVARADTFAGERNAAEARAAKAEAKMEALAEKVATLTEERTAARELLKEIDQKYHALESEKAALAAQLALIQKMHDELVIENAATKTKLAEVDAIIERRHLAQYEENERRRRGEDQAKPGIVDEP